MTHVSKQKLKKEDFAALYNQFSHIIALLDTKDSSGFLDELLTKAEKVMLTKRFSAIVTFREGCSVYRVSELLLMSPSTAEYIKLKYKVGKFRHIEKILEKEKAEARAFWRALESIFQAGLPPIGKGRWKRTLQ
jgi:uncharacterized protein YerC